MHNIMNRRRFAEKPEEIEINGKCVNDNKNDKGCDSYE
jgi:hypothetical protein